MKHPIVLSFAALPPEIWEKIVGYLSTDDLLNAMNTCSYLKSIVQDEIIVNSVNLTDELAIRIETNLDVARVRSVAISNFTRLKLPFLQPGHLRSISLQTCDNASPLLLSILRNCTSLQALEIEHNGYSVTPKLHLDTHEKFKCFKTLKTLRIVTRVDSWCNLDPQYDSTLLTWQSILCQDPESLESLYFDHHVDAQIAIFNGPIIWNFVAKLRRMKRLRLTDKRLDGEEFDKEELETPLRSQIRGQFDSTMILNRLKDLVTLEFTYHEDDIEIWTRVLGQLSNMEIIKATSYTDDHKGIPVEVLQKLLSQNKQTLTELIISLELNRRLPTTGFYSICPLDISEFREIRKLKKLSITINNSSNLAFPTAINLQEMPTSVEYLKLNKFNMSGEEAVEMVRRLRGLRQLQLNNKISSQVKAELFEILFLNPTMEVATLYPMNPSTENENLDDDAARALRSCFFDQHIKFNFTKYRQGSEGEELFPDLLLDSI